MKWLEIVDLRVAGEPARAFKQFLQLASERGKLAPVEHILGNDVTVLTILLHLCFAQHLILSDDREMLALT